MNLPFPTFSSGLPMMPGLNGLHFHQQLLQRHLLAQQQQQQQHYQSKQIEKTSSELPTMVIHF